LERSSDDRILDVLTAEIGYHEFFFTFVLIPLLSLFVPTISLTVYSFGLVAQTIAVYVFHANVSLAAVGAICGLYLILLLAFFWWLRRAKSPPFTLAWLHLPSTASSNAFETPIPRPIRQDDVRASFEGALAAMWPRFNSAGPIPSVSYFRSTTVLDAFAVADGTDASICVSEPLLDRGVEDPLTTLVLAHELTHIAYRDVTRIARLNRALKRYLFIARIAFLPLALVLSVLWLADSVHDVWSMIVIPETKNGLGGPLTNFVAFAFVLLPAPVSYVATMRYAGYIFSLIELRADAGIAVARDAPRFVEKTLRDHRTPAKLGAIERWFTDAWTLLTLNFSHFAFRDRVAYFLDRNSLILPKFKYLAAFIFIPILVTLSPAQWAFPQVFWVFCAQQVACASLIVISVLHTCDSASADRIPVSIPSQAALACWLLLAYFLPRASAEMLGMILLDIAKVVSIPGIEYPTWDSIFENCNTLMVNSLRGILRSLANGEVIIGLGTGYFAVWALSRPITGFSRSSVGLIVLILVALVAQAIAFWMTYPFPRPFNLWEYILGGPQPAAVKPWAAIVPLGLVVVHGLQILLFKMRPRPS
jgi:Zn-dependent protease with chaperone function